MKKQLKLAVAILFTFNFGLLTMQAQSSEKMSYQAVIRDTSDVLVSNQAIGIQISILQGSITGTAVYEETQTPTTNINGLVNLEIGNGNVVSGVFNTINWANGPYFIKTKIKTKEDTTYTIKATNQLMSVLYNKVSENVICAVSKPKIDSLELDFCEFSTNNSFSQKLINLNLKKGDFFTLKIKNINPYRYNINVTVKNDTIKIGDPPALFTQFMDPSSLGEIVSKMIPEVEFLENSIEDSTEENIKEFITTDENTSKMFINKEKIAKYSSVKKNQKKRDTLIHLLKEYIELKKIESLIEEINLLEEKYTAINDSYKKSIFNIYESQVDCYHLQKKVIGIDEVTPDNILKNQYTSIQDLLLLKKNTIKGINKFVAIKGIDSVKIKQMNQLKAELSSKKYSSLYLNSIYSKTYANFLIAKNTSLLSDYFSFPIQVKGDIMELKIDITPKKPSGKAKKEEEKKGSENYNSLSNQSPVNVYLNTNEKVTEKDKKKTKATNNEGLYASEELKVTMPAATREYHLSYKYRVNHTFFGFSSGFFIDGLVDDNYTNKPVDPLDQNTQYTIIEENKEFAGNYGIMATVNGGFYLNHKTDLFIQAFVGPGLTVDTELQPRLLTGIGFGKGEKNKISINGGIAIGQVKKLSNTINLASSYAVPQTDLYYKTNMLSWFLSINYVFDFKK